MYGLDECSEWIPMVMSSTGQTLKSGDIKVPVLALTVQMASPRSQESVALEPCSFSGYYSIAKRLENSVQGKALGCPLPTSIPPPLQVLN